MLRLSLEGDGYRVSTVANGRDALNHLRSHADTCMILLDLLLPSMDGMNFRNAQLRDRSLAWIPIVVLSGDPDARQKALEMGARSFVGKPLDLDQVKQALRNIRCRQADTARATTPLRRSA